MFALVVTLAVSQQRLSPPGDLAESAWHLDGPFVAGNLDDRNGDGHEDYVVCGPGDRVRVFSGVDDSEIEGSPEQLVAAREVARSLCFSARDDPELKRAPAFDWIRELANLEQVRARMLVPVDASGPRRDQRLVEGFFEQRPLRWHELKRPESRGAFTMLAWSRTDFAYIADLDADGVEDLLVHCGWMTDAWTQERYEEWPMGLVALSGKESRELWRVTLSGLSANPEYALPGWPNIASPGDLDGDGTRDFVLADPKHLFWQDECPSSILAISGRKGAILWRQNDEKHFGETLGATVALVSDRDGDGVRDVVYARGDGSERREHTLGIVCSKCGKIVKRWRP